MSWHYLAYFTGFCLVLFILDLFNCFDSFLGKNKPKHITSIKNKTVTLFDWLFGQRCYVLDDYGDIYEERVILIGDIYYVSRGGLGCGFVRADRYGYFDRKSRVLRWCLNRNELVVYYDYIKRLGNEDFLDFED